MPKADETKFDYKNYLDKPIQDSDEEKPTTVQQFKQDKAFLKDNEYRAREIDAARNRMSSIRSRLKAANEGLSDDAQEVVNPTYAKAIKDFKETDKMKADAVKVTKSEGPKDNKVKATPEMKKLHLNESLFEEISDQIYDRITVYFECDDEEFADHDYEREENESNESFINRVKNQVREELKNYCTDEPGYYEANLYGVIFANDTDEDDDEEFIDSISYSEGDAINGDFHESLNEEIEHKYLSYIEGIAWDNYEAGKVMSSDDFEEFKKLVIKDHPELKDREDSFFEEL
ncbi:hypothetical protein [uncultured Clostridium sp.]|uniref:hypothetical protein n=1 Tax=uncultured Clostridium sp. TaxID=59620 RepID=UPI00262746D7|nr:hypothetical protein [uncultured Clostridium sp.]